MAYPELLPTLPDALLMGALQDAAMLAPHTVQGDSPGLLFPTNVFAIKLGGDTGFNDANGQVVLPLTNIVITIGTHYGKQIDFCARDDGSTVPYAVGDITLPFTVWGSSASDLQDAQTRLIFAIDHRQSVFSNYGISLRGQMVPERRRPIDPKLGLFAEDHRWHFWWERS